MRIIGELQNEAILSAMIDEKILELSERQRRNLDGLEESIWAGVRTRLEKRQVTRAVVACQVVVTFVAMVGSAAVGTHAGIAAQGHYPTTAFSVQSEIAPSTLLGR